MMAGLPVGKVSSMDLADNDKSVDITLSILSKYKIRKDAQFRIDALGFLGDQYVAVSVPSETGLPTANDNSFLHDGDTVEGRATFNLLEAVQSISSVIDQARKTIKDLDQAITNVNSSALSPETLAHFARAMNNLEAVSEKAAGVADKAESLLNADAGPFNSAINNFQAMSARLTNTAVALDQIIVTNQDDVRKAIGNLAVASDQFKQIAMDLQAGKGAAGGLLKDDKMKAELADFLRNASDMTAEFGAFRQQFESAGNLGHVVEAKTPGDQLGPGSLNGGPVK